MCTDEDMGTNLPRFEFEDPLAAQEAASAAHRSKVECKQKKPVICQYWWRWVV